MSVTGVAEPHIKQGKGGVGRRRQASDTVRLAAGRYIERNQNKTTLELSRPSRPGPTRRDAGARALTAAAFPWCARPGRRIGRRSEKPRSLRGGIVPPAAFHVAGPVIFFRFFPGAKSAGP